MSTGGGYDKVYGAFESELAQQLRREALGDDEIGQQSWVTVAELKEAIANLRLGAHTRVLDLGCGAAGPLTFIVGAAGCRGVGIDVSAPAIEAGRARAAALGVDRQVSLEQADLDSELPYESRSFGAAIAIDAVLHVRDRAHLFREVARVMAPGARFWFTDAAVVTGPMSNQECRDRFPFGYSQFVPAGFNERTLEAAPMRILDVQDRTSQLAARANGRLGARQAHRAELELTEGHDAFESQRRYLEAVVALAERGAMARMSYLTEAG